MEERALQTGGFTFERPENSVGEALHAACEFGITDESVALAIIKEHGIEVINFRDGNNVTPLQKAIVYRHEETALALVEKLSVEALMEPTCAPAPHSGKRSPLRTACRTNSAAVVAALLARLPYEGISGRDLQGTGAIHEAVQRKSRECVRLLCEKLHAEDVISPSIIMGGSSVLHMLARAEGAEEMLLTVLESLPRDVIMRADARGLTPLHHAAQPPFLQDTLHARPGDEDLVGCGLEVFLDRATHEELIAPCEQGYTALHYALQTGNNAAGLRLMAVLCDQDLVIRDFHGQIPLHMIRFSRDARVVDEYLRRVSDAMSYRDNSGNSPLHSVLGSIQIEEPEDLILGRMLEAASRDELNATNKSGATPLRLTLKPNRRRCLQQLLNFDITESFFVLDNMGWTPLHEAAASCTSSELEQMVAMAPRSVLALHDLLGQTAFDVFIRNNPNNDEDYAKRLFQPMVKSAHD